METFDVVVVGAGPGGYPAAIRAAQLGAKTALIEREQLGGTCLNWGCIPTKTLIASAELLAQIRHAGELGVKVGPAEADYAAMVARKRTVVGQLQKGIRGLLSANGVTLLEGAAAFVTPTQLAVRGADGATHFVGAKHIILATGSTSAVPGFLPKHARVVESRGFLELTTLPKSLIVMGGGYIGCELACMAALLGVQVTVVELLEDVLMLLDADVRREVKKSMTQQLGMRILTGKALQNVEADAKGVRAKVGDEALAADVLLVAVGRKPVTDGLALERAGLAVNERGYIPVDAYNRTAVAHIFAIGDVNGGMQLAHAATSQGTIAAEIACGHKPTKNETLVPGVIFTAPEVGLIGLGEEDAKKQGRAIKVGKFPFLALGKALASAHTEGFVTWIADAATDQLLGAQAVGPHATDLIAEAAVAIRAELTAKELGRTIHAHPTFGEIWMEAAHAVHGEAVHIAPPRRK